jgi:hypothetical protein
MSDENDKQEVVPDFEEPRAPGVVSGTGQHQPVPGDDVPEAPEDFGHGPSGEESSEDVDERLADDDEDDDEDENEDNETA